MRAELYPEKPRSTTFRRFLKISGAKNLVDALMEQIKPFRPARFILNEMIESIERIERAAVSASPPTAARCSKTKLVVIAAGGGLAPAEAPADARHRGV